MRYYKKCKGFSEWCTEIGYQRELDTIFVTQLGIFISGKPKHDRSIVNKGDIMGNKSGYSRVILLIVFLASVAAPLNQFKVPPMMQQLMVSLNITISTSGWLMSVFALVGVVLALPVGLVIQRLGLKNTGLLALLALTAGSLLGTFSTSAYMMLTSRVIEGAGMCLISVMAPAAIAAWFPPERRGLPMGIWATWVPLGSILMFNIAPRIGGAGWKAVWIFSTGYTVAVFILMLALFRMPEEGEAGKPAPSGVNPGAAENAYANISIWLLALMFMLFNIMVLSVTTFTPVFLETMRGFASAKASGYASIIMVAALITGPAAGMAINALKSCKKIFVCGMFLAAVIMLFLFSSTGSMLIFMLVLAGIAVGMVPTATLTAAPGIMKSPAAAGIGMSVVMFGQNIGMFIGPALFGGVVQSHGWTAAAYAVVPLLAAGGIIALFIKTK